MTTEEWRSISGYVGRYQASNLGRIRSIIRPEPKVLLPRMRSWSLKVTIADKVGARSRGMAVGRLVLMAFVGMPADRSIVCRHLNGNAWDNRIENLAWGTQQENVDDQRRHGTLPQGERNPHARLTVETVRGIRWMLANGGSLKKTARAFGVPTSVISNIKAGRRWAHVA